MPTVLCLGSQIFEDTDSLSRISIIDKRDIDSLAELRGFQHTEGLSSARSPRQRLGATHHHDHGHDQRMVSVPSVNNETSSLSFGSILGKRTDPSGDSPLGSQDPNFTRQLQCPPGDTAAIRLPSFRCESPNNT